MRPIHALLFSTVLALGIAAAPKPPSVVINVDTKMEAPGWAVLERRILETSAPAMAEFYHRYYDENGNVQCLLRWGADDGQIGRASCRERGEVAVGDGGVRK